VGGRIGWLVDCYAGSSESGASTRPSAPRRGLSPGGHLWAGVARGPRANQWRPWAGVPLVGYWGHAGRRGTWGSRVETPSRPCTPQRGIWGHRGLWASWGNKVLMCLLVNRPQRPRCTHVPRRYQWVLWGQWGQRRNVSDRRQITNGARLRASGPSRGAPGQAGEAMRWRPFSRRNGVPVRGKGSGRYRGAQAAMRRCTSRSVSPQERDAIRAAACRPREAQCTS